VRLTIERLRTLILAAGILLVATLVVFLVVGRWKSRFIAHELPKRLGADIKQEANGITYTQSRHGHTLFKIHASREIQRVSGRVILHDVQIELYGPDGTALDRITGGEFEYDQKAGLATAAGPVEISMTRPTGIAPEPLGKTAHDKAISSALKDVAHAAGRGEINVKTSGLTFDQNAGVASTQQRVEFTTLQGTGSATGAAFDSQAGTLHLNHDVSLNVHRGADDVNLRAQSASFDRQQLVCRMRAATAEYRGESAAAGDAQVLFRPDGSAARLDARDGFTLSTKTGSKVSSPTGWMVFNPKNQPQRGFMFDGVTMLSANPGRTIRGTAPTAALDFTDAGELRHARLLRGVQIHSEQTGTQGATLVRTWTSPVVDIDLRKTGTRGPVQLSTVRGTDGVVISSEVRRGGAVEAPSRMAADTMVANFGPHQELTHVVGTGHATLDETTSTGARQTTIGDRLDARFSAQTVRSANSSAAIESADVQGHVILTDQPANKAGQPQPVLKATAEHATYDGKTQRLHLTGSPRIEDGGIAMTADRVDVSQPSGDAVARGNVKGTWQGDSRNSGIALGGQGPAHVVAAEADMSRASGEATFRGRARLWQQANSISAPVIVLNQSQQTLVAHGGPAEPLRLVMLSAPGPGRDKEKSQVLSVRAGDLHYSEPDRKAVLRRNVVAETGTATISSDQAEILLQPQGNHSAQTGVAQVNRVTARGHVQIVSQGRRGVGDQLVYTGETGNYVLTGTAADPPTLTDPARGVVRGTALIFNGRDDSVSIEGGGRKTTTQTVAPR